MAGIEIIREEERGGSWRFQSQWIDAGGSLRTCRLNLAWADYNLWSPDGTARPAAVAEAVLGFLLERLPEDEVPASLDASLARRLDREADVQIPRLIRR